MKQGRINSVLLFMYSTEELLSSVVDVSLQGYFCTCIPYGQLTLGGMLCTCLWDIQLTLPRDG